MTGQWIIDLALAQTYSDSTQLSQSTDVYLNIAYHTVENALIEWVGDDFFYEFIETDTIANQNEYPLPESTSSVAGFKKVLGVDIKRGTNDVYYTKLNNARNTEFKVSLDNLSSNLNQDLGVFDIKDWSLFIYPTPLTSVTDGLKVQVLQNLVDISSATAEASIFPWHTELRQWHYVVALCMKPYIFWEKGLYAEKQQSENEARAEIDRMIRTVANRYKGVTEGKLPDLSFYTR